MNDWIASWRISRRQLQTVAAGKLPRKWITWAKQDLAVIDARTQFAQRTGGHRTIKEKR